MVCTEEECFLEVFSREAAENCDVFFAQSQLHQAVIERRFPTLRGRIRTVGNARVDFLSSTRHQHFEAEVKEITDAYGPYILFNTNYAQINSIWKDKNHVAQIAALAGLLDTSSKESITEYKLKWEWEKLNREAMVNLIDWTIETLPEKNIILRPHPGEIADFWEDRYGSCERLHIVPRSNPHPWILGSELVVHTTCTTGLEAALMGKPVVNVVPGPHPTFDFATNHVNPTFNSWQDASKAMVEFFETGSGPIKDNEDNRTKFLANQFTIDDREANEKIADELLNQLREHCAAASSGRIPPMRGEGYRRTPLTDLRKDKFHLEADEMTERLRLALNDIGVSAHVSLYPLDESLFVLIPEIRS